MSDTPRTDALVIRMEDRYATGTWQEVVPSHRELERELFVTRAECDALRTDAERYRWLRVRNELPDGVDPSGPFVVIGDDGNVDYPSGAKLDAAIDAAREAGK